MEAVYIVDADSAIRDALKTLLESFDINVKAYADSDSFLQVFDGTPRGCVMVEAELPGVNGLGLLRELRNRDCRIPVVLLSNSTEPSFVARAHRAGAAGVLQKPLVDDKLADQLHAALGDDAWVRLTPSRIRIPC